MRTGGTEGREERERGEKEGMKGGVKKATEIRDKGEGREREGRGKEEGQHEKGLCSSKLQNRLWDRTQIS